MFPYQSGLSGETYQTYVAAPGGTTLGWTLAGGRFVSSILSAEAEVSTTGVMSAREPSRYGMTFSEERRDRFVGANVRFHLPTGSPVHIEPVAGFVVIRHQGWSRTEYFRYWLTPQQELIIEPRQSLNLPGSFGLTAGLDVRIGGRYFAFMPSFRLRPRLGSLGDDFYLGSHYPGGFPRWTVSSGIAGRVDF